MTKIGTLLEIVSQSRVSILAEVDDRTVSLERQRHSCTIIISLPFRTVLHTPMSHLYMMDNRTSTNTDTCRYSRT